MKFFIGTLSTTIGINLWFAPQISEHCPYINPGRSILILPWFNRPGTASILIPKAGTAHEWITSAAVTSNRICEFIGKTVRLSTSSNRNLLFSISLTGVMYESNSRSWKSEYSYFQYHWCPITLIVIIGLLISSIMYNNRSDGSAIKISVIAGSKVHNISIVCPSNKYRLINLLLNNVIIT